MMVGGEGGVQGKPSSSFFPCSAAARRADEVDFYLRVDGLCVAEDCFQSGICMGIVLQVGEIALGDVGENQANADLPWGRLLIFASAGGAIISC